MIDQRIGFCSASDGVRIAYATVGRGRPLVYATGWPEHLEVEWGKPFVRAFLQKLAGPFSLIRYDMRGSGLSDRDISDFSLAALVRDLEAVVGHLALNQFPLISLGDAAGPIAMMYAAAHPERVTHLVLHGAYVRGSEIAPPERQRSLIEYVRNYGFPHFGFIDQPGIDAEKQRDIRKIQAASASNQMMAQLLEAIYSTDVSHLLSRLSVRALVMHGTGDPLVPFDQGRELAARLPNAQFVPFASSTAAPWAKSEIIIPEIHRFLGVEVEPEPPEPIPSGTAVILFADIADSTALTERLGDAAFREKAREMDGALRGITRESGGTPIEGKLLGDGVLAVFTSARQAIEAALRGAAAGSHGGLPLHLGIHAGDVIREEGNIYGGAVNIAARISGLSAAGEVLVSETVRSLARTSAGVRFEDRGERELKGVGEPVRVWAVRGGEAS